MKAKSIGISLILAAVVASSSLLHAADAPAPAKPLTKAQKRDLTLKAILAATDANQRVVASACTSEYYAYDDEAKIKAKYCIADQSGMTDAIRSSDLIEGWDSSKRTAFNVLCETVQPWLPEGYACDDLIQVRYSEMWTGCVSQYQGGYYLDVTAYGSLEFSLTPLGSRIYSSTLFYDQQNYDVAYNVKAVWEGLRELKLLPRQRKNLDGFWKASRAFLDSLKAEQTKQAQGKPFKPVTHRDFVAQANLMAAYYRYLASDLAEYGQLGSEADGEDFTNKNAVLVIQTAVQNVIDAYGLDTDVVTKQAADYGQVFVDLANSFGQSLTESERQAYIRPIVILLGSQVIPIAAAAGDASARGGIEAFKAQWENAALQAFLRDKLSATDDRLNSLILNLSTLAYKIGQTVDIEIKVLEAKDVERRKAAAGNG